MVNQMKLKRFLKGKSQDQFSQETGIDQSRISRIERGFAVAKDDEKRALAHALSAAIEDLFPKEE